MIPSQPLCTGKIMLGGVWIICQSDVHNHRFPHASTGLNHNVFWDDSGYYENRIF